MLDENQNPRPDFIPGIYNFCDHRCGKCRQQKHCISYAMNRKLEARPSAAPAAGKGTWGKFRGVFESTYAALHELAEERGMGVEEICASEDISREFLGDEFRNAAISDREVLVLENSVLMKTYAIYESMAIEVLDGLFKGVDKEADFGDDVLNGFDLLNCYFELVPGKIRETLLAAGRNFRGHTGKEDHLGLAKVVLLAVDRSLEVWNGLQEHFPDCREGMEALKKALEQLAADLEFQFPGARAFRRPGLDQDGAGSAPDSLR